MIYEYKRRQQMLQAMQSRAAAAAAAGLGLDGYARLDPREEEKKRVEQLDGIKNKEENGEKIEDILIRFSRENEMLKKFLFTVIDAAYHHRHDDLIGYSDYITEKALETKSKLYGKF